MVCCVDSTLSIKCIQKPRMWGPGCTNLELGDGQRSVVLVQGDEDEEGRDRTILLLLGQRGHVHQHLNLHRPVTGEREPARHCHHAAWGGQRGKVGEKLKPTFDWISFPVEL